MFYKPEIRNKMERRRKKLDLISIAQAAQAVAAQAIQLTEFLKAQHVGCYLAIDGELDPLPTLECAHTLKKHLYLPVISPTDTLDFLSYTLGDPLLKGVHGISAPAHRTQLPSPIAKLELIFVPLVAFDSHCNRLGRGAGHYDRTLNAARQENGHLPYLIGLAYGFQKVPKIDTDEWDVPLDMVITPEAIYRR